MSLEVGDIVVWTGEKYRREGRLPTELKDKYMKQASIISVNADDTLAYVRFLSGPLSRMEIDVYIGNLSPTSVKGRISSALLAGHKIVL